MFTPPCSPLCGRTAQPTPPCSPLCGRTAQPTACDPPPPRHQQCLPAAKGQQVPWQGSVSVSVCCTLLPCRYRSMADNSCLCVEWHPTILPQASELIGCSSVFEAAAAALLLPLQAMSTHGSPVHTQRMASLPTQTHPHHNTSAPPAPLHAAWSCSPACWEG